MAKIFAFYSSIRLVYREKHTHIQYVLGREREKKKKAKMNKISLNILMINNNPL